MLPTNFSFFEIIDKYSVLLNNGMGGIQVDTLSLIIECEDIGNYDVFITKCNIYFSNLLSKED